MCSNEDFDECDSIECLKCVKQFCKNCDKTEIENNMFADYSFPYECTICHRFYCSQCNLQNNTKQCVQCYRFYCSECVKFFCNYPATRKFGICIKCIKTAFNDNDDPCDDESV